MLNCNDKILVNNCIQFTASSWVVTLNMTNVKRVKTSQVTTNIKINWQWIQCHLHNLLPFFHFLRENGQRAFSFSFHRKWRYTHTNFSTMSLAKRLRSLVYKCCRDEQALYIPALDGGQQRMAVVILQKRLTGSSLSLWPNLFSWQQKFHWLIKSYLRKHGLSSFTT